MSPAPHPADGMDAHGACDKVVIQTYEGDADTMTLRLIATIVIGLVELRDYSGDFSAAA
jgi:hypothetical protein